MTTSAWWGVLVFYSLVCGLGGGMIMQSKNRSWFQGFALGLGIGLIGLLITVGIAPLAPSMAQPQRAIPVSEWQPPPEPMGLPATLSAVAVGIAGGLAIIVGFVALANWLL